ncbi:hypothetical protein INS49_009755 [Diaporthe citri]|uniref:uncharacterized protein n=1 Tax=Diaporthe citri TaxID=83186 RepID=UPI001C814F36|nr:uncharacterized protein INS49_009755 [Diaporthe citri]KAG6361528.1 hypothetical protein INS49_009755 [Diaporthe citri]
MTPPFPQPNSLNNYRERHLSIKHCAKEQKLSNFQRQSEGKSGRIQELEEDRVRLQEQLESANQHLEDRSTKLSELQKKCRTYKEHLNSATAEQQDLYKAAKTKCETAIKQMREEEHKRKALDEQQRKDLQATRERLTQIVKSTVAEYSSKEREFNNKLDSLHQRIQEREADVKREQETIRGLLEQNATVESIQGAVKTFEAQIEQITAKLGELASSQVERDGAAAEETHAKLDKIVEHLCALDKRVEPQASIIEKIQEANVQTFSTMLNPVLKSHTEIQSNLQKLSDAVEDYMEDFWMKLEDREDVLTELLEQTQADNAQLQADVQLREDECKVLLDNLEQAEVTNRQREKDLEGLKNEIAELEQAQANDMEQAVRAKSLHEDCEKLKVDVAGKAALTRNLEVRLQHSQAALLNETEQHKRHTQELQRLMEQREEAARAAQEAAVQVARQEVTRDMGIAKENISTLLKQVQTESTALKDELNAAKQQVSMVEEMNKRADTTVDELRSELATAQTKANRLGEEANEKDMEIRKAIDHRSAQVTDLEAKLARKEREITQLSEDAQMYDKQVQKALDGLKEWTKSHHAVKGFVSELGKAQDGDLNGIDPKLKAFLEIDILHEAIFQYCQAQGRSAPMGDQGIAGESTTSKDVWADLPPNSPQKQMPPKNLATRVLDQVGRRVIIRSPSTTRAESAITGEKTQVRREPRKRKQIDRPEMGSPQKRASVHTEKGSESQVPPSAPRKRARKNTNIFDELISPVRSFYFEQSVSTAGHEAGRQRRIHTRAEDSNLGNPNASLASSAISNSQDGSQDSQSLEYPRRRSSRQNEDSQDSITHSQRVRSEPTDPPYRAKRFTMGQ